MSAKYRTRVIILIISVVVMLVLFFLNIRRASESALPTYTGANFNYRNC